jgi:regulator-associated protein of mTOR
MSSILVWDLDKEQLLSTIQSSGDSAISSLVSFYCHALKREIRTFVQATSYLLFD